MNTRVGLAALLIVAALILLVMALGTRHVQSSDTVATGLQHQAQGPSFSAAYDDRDGGDTRGACGLPPQPVSPPCSAQPRRSQFAPLAACKTGWVNYTVQNGWANVL